MSRKLSYRAIAIAATYAAVAAAPVRSELVSVCTDLLVTALLHGVVLVKIGVYVFARLFLAAFAFDVVPRTAVAMIAAASALMSAWAALLDTDFKRMWPTPP